MRVREGVTDPTLQALRGKMHRHGDSRTPTLSLFLPHSQGGNNTRCSVTARCRATLDPVSGGIWATERETREHRLFVTRAELTLSISVAALLPRNALPTNPHPPRAPSSAPPNDRFAQWILPPRCIGRGCTSNTTMLRGPDVDV